MSIQIAPQRIRRRGKVARIWGWRPARRVPPPGYRNDIQGLRMVAVVAVILHHLTFWPAGGFVGVDVFFVISGFLITGLLVREYSATGSISFSGFYRNRIRRIVPAAVVTLVLTLAVAWLVFNQERFLDTLLDGFWALIFAANWHAAASGVDYFQSAGPQSPLQHYWSLAVEEQFYLLWPWLLLGTLLLANRRAQRATTGDGTPGSTVRPQRPAAPLRTAGLVLAGLTALSLGWSLWETAASPTVAYFSSVARVWELGVGALLAIFASAFTRLGEWSRRALAYGGLAGIAVSLAVINDASAFPGPWALLPVLSTAAVIIAGTGGQSPPLWPLTNRVSSYVGTISYSLYLWHFPVIIIGTALFGDGPAERVWFAVVLTLAAIYSYHLVEEPVRRSGWLRGKRRRPAAKAVTPTYKLAVVSLLALSAVGVSAAALAVHSPRTADPLTATALGDPAMPDPATAEDTDLPPQVAALQREIASALLATEWPALDPTFEEVIAGRQAHDDIADCGFATVDEEQCTWGDPEATRTALVVGSSIGMTYTGALRAAIGDDQGWNLVSYAMFGCQFGDYTDYAGPERPDGCEERPDQAVEAINRLQPEVVFVAGIRSTEETLRQLAKVDVDTSLVFIPQPPADVDIAECYTRFSQPADCVGQIPPEWSVNERRTAAAAEAQFLDPTLWFCAGGRCPSFVGTVPVKMDITHLAPAYAEYLGPVVAEALQTQDLLSFDQP